MPDSIITQKVGPLTGGVWIVVIGAGLGIGFYLRNRAASGGASAVVSPSAGNGTSGTGPGGWSATTAPDATSPTPPTTAALWAVGALAWLLTHNYDAALSDSAIRKYLASQPLTAQEQAVINAVLSGYGPPPEILPPTGIDVPTIPAPIMTGTPIIAPDTYTSFLRDAITGAIYGVTASGTRVWLTPAQWAAQGKQTYTTINAPAPVKAAPKPAPPPVPKTNVRKYTVKSGDNLTSIGAKYGRTWQQIYNANTNLIRNPNLIYAGQVLVIP